MLQCSPAAARSLAEIRTQQGLPDTFGARLLPVQDSDGQVRLGVELAEMTLDVVPDPTADGDAPAQAVLRPRSG